MTTYFTKIIVSFYDFQHVRKIRLKRFNNLSSQYINLAENVENDEAINIQKWKVNIIVSTRIFMFIRINAQHFKLSTTHIKNEKITQLVLNNNEIIKNLNINPQRKLKFIYL
jgi:hypothetical protein